MLTARNISLNNMLVTHIEREMFLHDSHHIFCFKFTCLFFVFSLVDSTTIAK